MVSSLVVNLINVAVLLVHPTLRLGASGAALATALSRGVDVCCSALVAHSGMLHDPGTVTLADCHSLTGKMLRIGIVGKTSSLFSLGKLLVQQLYASLGTVALAANAAAGALSCIATLPGGAISLAMLPVIGQAIGAGKPDEARRLGRKLLAIAYVLMLGTNLLVYIFLPQLSGLYGLTAETTAVVHDLLLWHCIFASLFYPAGFCIPAALRAAGDVRYPMVISVASMLVFRVGLSFVFVRGFGLGVVSIWMAIFVDWALGPCCSACASTQYLAKENYYRAQHHTIPALRASSTAPADLRLRAAASGGLRSKRTSLSARCAPSALPKMLENTRSILCAFCLAAGVFRSPYRHLGIVFCRKILLRKEIKGDRYG